MTRGTRRWCVGRELLALFILIAALTGCDLQFGQPQYISAQSSVDPFATVRKKAEQYYQAGLTEEQKGNWANALKDFRQASTWDHDGRQDIADALSRAQAQVDWQTAQKPTNEPATQPPTSSSSAAANTTIGASRTPLASVVNNTGTGLMKHFDSANFPYSVAVPQNWIVHQGGSAQHPADEFVAPSTATSNALVLITVEPAKFQMTLDGFYIAASKSLGAQGIHNVQIFNRRQVAGQPAYILTYLDTTGLGSVSVRHAIFVTPGKAWQVILLAAPAVTSALNQTFSAMLDSFDIRASAFPTQ